MDRAARYALVLTAACGHLGFEAPVVDGSSDTASPKLVIDPPPAVLLPFTQMQFRATLDGVGTTGVTWSVDSGAGSITATGQYTAPAMTGGATVRATSTTDPKLSTTADVAIGLPQPGLTIASTGGLPEALGFSHQTHVIRTEAGEWWLWYITDLDPLYVHTRHSMDFVQWADGAALTLPNPHGNDARNIDLAYKRINGVDVIHATIGFIDTTRGRFHVKATVTPGAITFEAPQLINAGGNADPDGPATVITQSNLVIDGTGWEGTPSTPPLTPCGVGDLEMFTAATPDDGTTDFATMTFTREVRWCVPVYVNARKLIADGDTVYELFEDGTQNTLPVNILYNIRRPDGTWLPDETVYTTPPSVFASNNNSFQLNDWAVARLGNQLHAIRRTSGAVFEHRSFVLGSEGAWSTLAPPAQRAANDGTGLVLVPYGTGLLAAQTSGTAIDYAFFDGIAWSPWTPAVTATASRIAAGSGGASGRPALIWETPGTQTTIAGVLLP